MTVILFLIILFILVLVHELGHFLAAKFSGVRVDEFGIGFPPKVAGIKKGETEYTLNLLPIGGFVKIFGENPDAESLEGADSARSMARKSRWVQAMILVAGVTFNIVFAWLLFTVGFMVGLPASVEEEELSSVRDPHLFIGQVLSESPAEKAGIKSGDEILSLTSNMEMIEGSPLTPESVSNFVSSVGEGEIVVRTKRGDEESAVVVVPEQGLLEGEPDRFAMGISMNLAGIKQLPVHEAIIEGTLLTGDMFINVAKSIALFLRDALTFKADFSQVTGPVGIAGLVGEASTLGFAYLVTFTAFISLNLAVINLIPFPALDGGRLLIVIIEGTIRRRVKPAIVNGINVAGFALLLILMAIITFNDIARIFS